MKNTEPSTVYKIRLEQVTEQVSDFHHLYSKKWLQELLSTEKIYTPTADASFVTRITKMTGSKALVQSKATLHLDSECRRCLKPVHSAFDLSFLLTMVPQKKQSEAKPSSHKKQQEQDFETTLSEDEEYFDGENIDLRAVFEEQIQLGLPAIEPLCSDDCTGIASPLIAPTPQPESVDPRWAALKNLKLPQK